MPNKSDDTLPEKKMGVQLSKKALQERIRPHALKAIEVLLKEMEAGDSSSSRIGAAKTILAKVIPDLKATELTGEDGQAIRILIQDYGASNNTSTQTKGSSTN